MAASGQPTPGHCAATLIAPNKVATAGHCIKPHLCGRLAFVFGATSDAMVFGTRFAADLRYSCASVEISESTGGQDWAVVRLDRSVPDSVASPVRVASTEVTIGTPVMCIGHPDDLPRKYAGDAQVNEVMQSGTDAFRFATNLDTFVGSSGSGVFDIERREMVGILVSGRRDYDDKGCAITYPLERGGEWVTGAKLLLPYSSVPASSASSPPPPSPPPHPPPHPPSAPPAILDGGDDSASFVISVAAGASAAAVACLCLAACVALKVASPHGQGSVKPPKAEQKPKVEPEPEEKKRTKVGISVKPPKAEQKTKTGPEHIKKQVDGKPNQQVKKPIKRTAHDEKHYVMLLSETKFKEMETQHASVFKNDSLLDAIVYVNEDSNKASFKIGCINPHLLKKDVKANTNMSFAIPNKPEEQRRYQEVRLNVTYFKNDLKDNVQQKQIYAIEKQKLESQMKKFDDATILYKI